MPLKSVIRASYVVGLLLWCGVSAAERKPSLIGATREDVLARFGEPKSSIVAGGREVLFFTGERIVLRDNRVVEVEEVPVETTTPPPAKPAAGGQDAETTGAADTANTGNVHPPVQPAAVATSPAVAAPSEPSPEASADTGSAAAPAAPREPVLVIKSVRPPSKTHVASELTPVAPPSTKPAVVPPPVTPAKSPASKPVAATPPSSQSAAVTSAAVPSEVIAHPTTSAEVHGAKDAAAVAADSDSTPVAGTAPDAPAALSEANATEPASEATPTTAKPAAPHRHASAAPEFPDTTESIFTLRTYLLAFVIIGGGSGYLVWRRRNRQLILEATAVSHSPFAAEPAASNTVRFTQELLNKLEWKRFEELVAAYYNKTGVVAVRTKSGPSSPVHVRISWKGEQRPFACVHCVAQPSGLIGPKPVQALCDVLAAEDIRRGYVLTSGKFGVPARDVAEEKQVTLISGDIFLEKLNALPDPARAELMRDATNGDYMTPTCPRCETKMSRSPSDPTEWQCPQCGTLLPKL